MPSPFLQFPLRQLPLVLHAATEKQITTRKRAHRYLSLFILGTVRSFTVKLPKEVGKDVKGFRRGIAIQRPLADSFTIYSSGGPVIACSDRIKRVGAFPKNSFVLCFIPDDNVPGGFLIIVVGSYQIPMASLSLYGNIHIL